MKKRQSAALITTALLSIPSIVTVYGLNDEAEDSDVFTGFNTKF